MKHILPIWMGFTDPESTHKGKINFSEILAPINKGASTPPLAPYRPPSLTPLSHSLSHSPLCLPGGQGGLYFGYLRTCSPYGWVFEKVYTYDGCFFEHSSTYYGYCFEI